MTTGEIITVAVSGLALIVSGITAYLTLLARFDGYVIPRYRVILTQIDGKLFLVLECEFANDGARAGIIQDILVRMLDEQGNPTVFKPYGTKEQFSIFQIYRIEELNLFSGISIGAKQRKDFFVLFIPGQPNFTPVEGKIHLRTFFSARVDGKKYKKSIVEFSLDLKEDNIKQWVNPGGKSQQLSAVEIGKSRTKFLQDNKI